MHVAAFPSYKYKPIRKRRSAARKMKPAPKRPLQSETLEQEPLQPETLEQEPLQQELMQLETQSYLAPLLDDQKRAMLCENDFADVVTGDSAGEDAIMRWIIDINKELDALEYDSSSPAAQLT